MRKSGVEEKNVKVVPDINEGQKESGDLYGRSDRWVYIRDQLRAPSSLHR